MPSRTALLRTPSASCFPSGRGKTTRSTDARCTPFGGFILFIIVVALAVLGVLIAADVAGVEKVIRKVREEQQHATACLFDSAKQRRLCRRKGIGSVTETLSFLTALLHFREFYFYSNIPLSLTFLFFFSFHTCLFCIPGFCFPLGNLLLSPFWFKNHFHFATVLSNSIAITFPRNVS